MVYPNENHARGGRLHLVDLGAWQMRATDLALDAWPDVFLYSADGARLLVTDAGGGEYQARLLDTGTGALLAESHLPFAARLAAFTPDGAGLMVYGASYPDRSGLNPQPRAALLETATLTVVWEQALPDIRHGQYAPEGTQNVHDESYWWQPGTAFDPAAGRLYLVHADDEKLTTVDYGARSVTTVDVAPPQSWLDRLMALTAGVAEAKMLNGSEKQALLSPDGQRLYVLGYRYEYAQATATRTPLGLQVIETATGTEAGRLDTAAASLQLAPGGQFLLLTEWAGETPVTEVVRLEDLAVSQRLPGLELRVTRSPGGSPRLVAQTEQASVNTVRLFDPATLAPLAGWQAPPNGWLVMP
jgi:hypothetical protein